MSKRLDVFRNKSWLFLSNYNVFNETGPAKVNDYNWPTDEVNDLVPDLNELDFDNVKMGEGVGSGTGHINNIDDLYNSLYLTKIIPYLKKKIAELEKKGGRRRRTKRSTKRSSKRKHRKSRSSRR